MEQNLSLYRIFYEVARNGNISWAAKELYISQPAISKSISKLEDSLGVSLFSRNSRGVLLTEEGELLYQYISAAFASLKRGEEELKRMKEFDIGELKIGVSTTLCKYILLPYLKAFIAKYPHIKITIESRASAQTLEHLEEGEVDIGVVATPFKKKDSCFYPIQEIEEGFICSPSYLKHLELTPGVPVQSEIFKKATVMLLDKKNATRLYIDEYLRQNNIEIDHILEVTNMDLLIEFAKIGLGVSCVIKDFVQEELSAGQLVEIPLKPPIKKRTVGFAYSKHPIHQRTLQLFLDFCQNLSSQA